MVPEKRLFWFLREGVRLDLADPATLDSYIQQVMTRGRAEDVVVLLRRIGVDRLRGILPRLGRFLPVEVRMFWEDFIASHQ